MGDGEALMRAILAHPAEDTPRLVYADYLEESGEPACVARATFVRLQVDAVRLAPSRRRDKLEIDADQLLHRWFPEWVAPVAELLGMAAPYVDFGKQGGTVKSLWWERNADDRYPVRWTWDRGFIGSMRIPGGEFLSSGPQLFALHPVTAITLSDVAYYEEPWRDPESPPASWFAAPDDRMGWYAGAVAERLWELLPGKEVVLNGYDAKTYRNRNEAKAALGVACLAFARVEVAPCPG